MEQEIQKDIEAGVVWDDKDQQWKPGYETALKRIETVIFVRDVLFDSAAEEYTSDWFECAAFKDFLLNMDIDVTGSPTNVQIYVQFSPERARGYNLVEGPYGSLIYVTAQGDRQECLPGKIRSHWMRVKVVSSGCSAGNTFKVKITGELSG